MARESFKKKEKPKNFKYLSNQLYSLYIPPEHVRKIIRDHGDMTNRFDNFVMINVSI